MTLLHISDTHGQHRTLGELPEADVLVHSGDFTQKRADQDFSSSIHRAG